MTVVDLTGPGIAQIGADGRLTSGDNYALSQRWAARIFAHPQQPDGVLYRARHDQSRISVALFSRAEGAVGETLHGGLLEPRNQRYLAAVLGTYPVALLP